MITRYLVLCNFILFLQLIFFQRNIISEKSWYTLLVELLIKVSLFVSRVGFSWFLRLFLCNFVSRVFLWCMREWFVLLVFELKLGMVTSIWLQGFVCTHFVFLVWHIDLFVRSYVYTYEAMTTTEILLLVLVTTIHTCLLFATGQLLASN